VLLFLLRTEAMLIPLGTDAPLYHFPWATIGLIAVNVVCFAVTGFGLDAEALWPWMLQHGPGVNPVQWFSSAFVHAGWTHLIGNMLFLWTFGLVVEGKLGWRRFLPLYLVLTAGCGLVEDLVTQHYTKAWRLEELAAEQGEQLEAGDAELLAGLLPDEAMGGSLGASAVIMGLMAISLVWAPRNEVQVILLLFRFGMFDLSILTMSLIYAAMDLAQWLWDPRFSVPAVHLMGLVLGFGAGVLYLKRGWVECENWDLFAVLAGRHGQSRESGVGVGLHAAELKTYAEPVLPGPVDDGGASRGKLLQPINELIDGGDVLAAADSLLELRLTDADVVPNEARTKKLALGLLQADAWDHAEIWLQEYVQRYPEENRWARIRLAQLLLRNGRPKAALLQLKGLQTGGLNEGLLKVARKVLQEAQEQRRQGVEDAEDFV
jgi:membrane associated rhomboid family serine protease